MGVRIIKFLCLIIIFDMHLWVNFELHIMKHHVAHQSSILMKHHVDHQLLVLMK